MSDQNLPPLFFSASANPLFSRRLVKELNSQLGSVEIMRFCDQESRIIIKDDAHDRDVYLIQPTSMPANEHIMELLLMAHAVKSMKPQRLTAVMPFFGYRRQEKRLHSGESLAFELIAKLLRASGVNRVITIDLHKHRSVRFFKENNIVCKELRVFNLFVEYFQKKKLENFVILAPDKGSIPEAERYSRVLNIPLVKVYKHRFSHRPDEVAFDRMVGEVRGKNILIIDDEISTGGTLIGIIEMLKQRQAGDIHFACTHGILAGKAIERLRKAPVKEIVITDTIFLPPEKRLKKIIVLSVAPLFAEVIKKLCRQKKN